MDLSAAFIVIIVLFLAMVVFPVIVNYKIAGTLIHPFWKAIQYNSSGTPPGFELYRQLLGTRFSYFRLLNSDEQKRFVSRLRFIRDSKEFIGRGLQVTEEMEVLISAALTQLTFGLQEFELENLESIHITPESFYSRLVGRQVKGLTFTSGRMMLSWADFVEGYRIDNDKVNLALHEMAHALMLDEEAYMEIEDRFEQWETAALQELRDNRATGNLSFLRDYAFSNKDELWACCVECFFEAPVDFKKLLPNMYAKMCTVLKQDMAARVAGVDSLTVTRPTV